MAADVPGLIEITPEVAEAFAAAIKPRLDALKAEWEQHREECEAAFDSTGARMEWIGGNCPVQAEGEVDGEAFYFRARGQRWTFTTAERQSAIFDRPTFHVECPYGTDRFDAGWMPLHHAYTCIVESIRLYRERKGQ